MDLTAFAPFPLAVHVTFCIIATIFLIYQLFRRKRLYYVFFVIGVDLSLLTQAIKKYNGIAILGIIELILFILTVTFMIIKPKNEREALKAEKENQRIIKQSEDELDDEDEDI